MTALWLIGLALGQDYAFPTSPDHRVHWYPTAYKDHAGVDWNCGSIRYGGHNGSDFGAGSFEGMDDGRDVTAAAPGTVVTVNDGEFDRCTTADCAGGYGFGNYVAIEHPNGRSTYYAHLKQFSVLVDVGDVVTCGQKLGEMGSSGYSTGPHLHFEVRGSSGIAEDPFDGPCSGPPTYWTDQGIYAELPGEVCEDPEPCTPEAELTCGDVVVGRNDDGGSTSATYAYGCSEFVYTGPERSFTVLTDLDEPVTISLAGLGADLDLMALSSSDCDGTGCLDASTESDVSDEQIVVDAVAGEPITVVVDGWEGAVSDFTLSVDCDGQWGGTEPVDTSATADTGESGGATSTPPVDTGPGGTTPTDGDDDDDGLDDVDTLTPPPAVQPTGCSCETQPPGPLLWGLLTRRRR